MTKFKKIFISSSLKNRELNAKIAKLFEKKGFKVYLPQRDTPQTDDVKTIFNANVNAIKESNIIVAVLINHGHDLAFEIGLAYGLGKPIIALASNTDYTKDEMIAGALTDITTDVNELLDKVIGHINENT
ncbi:MAG: hypothetical protein DRJ31_10995 [Candidatus Methanomethylicota archaeon]|uniref:Nucleoside 2-deoxyribosyltransferase n=1 Tax=Thermoproteota archaeon TaxID=2056631 RepID=A0A497EJ67_9CREN|nr:MAG: hypothetical protein DRJ31_10995 [Candidatus Verstraetearchaeota archaeon]